MFFQWCYKRALKNDNKKSLAGYTQREANELFEKSEFPIASKFAIFFRNLGMAMLFLPILPIGVFFSIGAVTLAYWIDKWTLLKRSTSRFYYSSDLAQSMKKEFDFCLICFTFGMVVKEAILNLLNS